MNKVVVTDRSGESRSFEVSDNMRILHAGLLAGVGLPHECGTGTCGMCKAKLEEGEVTDLWEEAPGRKSCRRRGEVLMCQSGAGSDVSLSLRTAFPPPLDPDCETRKGRLVLRERLTDDVALFYCTLDSPLPYKAGQFALVGLPGLAGLRAWSMIDHTPGAAQLDFLLRRAPQGGASAMAFNGTCDLVVDVIGPLGRAVYEPAERRPFIAIAGGSGIAGMLAILARCEAAGLEDIGTSHIVFGLRDPDSAYLLDRLNAAVARMDGALQVTVAFSDAPAPASMKENYGNLSFTEGLVHSAATPIVARAKEDGANAIHFVAGPPVMVDATLQHLITTLNIAAEDIRFDRFG